MGAKAKAKIMQNEKKPLTIAIQKSGRLYEDSVKLLKDCGIGLKNGINKLKTEAENFPLEVFFLRDDDIPQYVQDRVADVGIVGENVLYEKQLSHTGNIVGTRLTACSETEKAPLEIVEKLGFGKCRLSIAVQRSETYTGPQFLQGKSIATSYPGLVKKFLSENNLQTEIHEISGSVEIAPGIGLADAIADLVSSGSTLFMNGLAEAETILKSEAVLVKNDGLDEVKQALLNKLLFRIRSVKKARNNKYILLNAPNEKLEEIKALLPGMKSPTVMPLADAGWSSVHSVVNENDFWEIIEQLQAAGAQGILVVPIEKMII